MWSTDSTIAWLQRVGVLMLEIGLAALFTASLLEHHWGRAVLSLAVAVTLPSLLRELERRLGL